MLLFSARKTLASRWICLSCRRASTISAADRPLSKAAQELRDGGHFRTRFAPSPTGYLHLGSLRTALFNYLVAKATGGQFLLRIEDTDQKRTVPDAEQRLYEDLEWAGIEWDEGPKIGGEYGPYKQSQRTAIYREHVEQLLDSGNAYRCFCTPQRLLYLAQHRESLGQQPDYDRKCAHIRKEESDDRAAKGEAHVVRLKAPDKSPVFNDLVFGRVRHRGELKKNSAPTRGSYYNSAHPGSYYDPILMKSDGFPTYHLANVVDDHLMKITHVIRGSEWMPSTPKHLELYQAFGWQPPAFAHVSLLVDKHGAKLSKRTGSIDLSEWRDKQGIFPGALINFAALLGWSHNESDDFMEMEDLIRRASLKFTKGDTKVAFEKLWFLQRKHAQHYASLDPLTVDPRRDLNLLAVKPIMKYLEKLSFRKELPVYKNLPPGAPRENFVRSLLLGDARNYTNPEEFINRSISFFIPPTKETLQSTIPHWNWKLHHVPRETDKKISPAEFLALLEVYDHITDSTWNKGELKFWTDTIIKQMLLKSIDETPSLREDEAITLRFEKAWSSFVHRYIRWAIMGAKSGPDGSVAMSILGREETLRRLALGKKVVLETYGEDGEDGEARRDDNSTGDGAVMTGMLMGGMAGPRVSSAGSVEPEPVLTEQPQSSSTFEDGAAPSEMDRLVEDEAVPDKAEVFLEDDVQPSEEESGWDWGEDDGDGGDFGDGGD